MGSLSLLELAKQFAIRCKCINPTYRAELKGGISVCIDFQEAINKGHLKSVDDVLNSLSKREENIQAELELLQFETERMCITEATVKNNVVEAAQSEAKKIGLVISEIEIKQILQAVIAATQPQKNLNTNK